MFNLQGSEIIFILLLALVVLGPEKLPSAIRRFTQTYAELRKMGTGFQTELRSALDEPIREMRETADLIMENADPSRIADDAERVVAESDRETADDERFDTPSHDHDDEQRERDAERKERAKQVLAKRREQRFSFDLPGEVNGATDDTTEAAAGSGTGTNADASADASTAEPTGSATGSVAAEAAPGTRGDEGPAGAEVGDTEPVDEWADPVDEESTA